MCFICKSTKGVLGYPCLSCVHSQQIIIDCTREKLDYLLPISVLCFCENPPFLLICLDVILEIPPIVSHQEFPLPRKSTMSFYMKPHASDDQTPPLLKFLSTPRSGPRSGPPTKQSPSLQLLMKKTCFSPFSHGSSGKETQKKNGFKTHATAWPPPK